MTKNEDSCTCCPYGFHIHVDFAKFAEEQLSVKQYENRRESPQRHSMRKSSNSLMISKKSKIFTDENTEASSKSAGSSKLKHAKRESLFIQQRILNLQTSGASKTKEEIYGSGLLLAVKEFEDYVTKAWGRGRKSKEDKGCTLFTKSESQNCLQHGNSKLLSAAPEISVTNEKYASACESPKVNDSDVCFHCQRKCPCKTFTSVIADKSTSTEVNSKDAYLEFIPNCSTAKNTISTEHSSTRSEQLSKLTIHSHGPTVQTPDCGGEGSISAPTMHTTMETELKCVKEFAEDLTEVRKVTETGSDLELEEVEYGTMSPTDDMKAALKIVNDALLHGRTGRNVASSKVVILDEWFQVVGSTATNEKEILNYIQAFESYSSQLLRYMVNVPDASGITALHYAVSFGNFPVISKLLDTNMVDTNKPNKTGYTSVMLASLIEIANAQQEQILRRLISLSDVNIKAAQHGQTALMLAASNGRFQMVKLLMDAGADVNAQDEDGSTALMCAVEHGHADIVQCLLAQPGCNPNLHDNDGLTALNVAMEAGHKDIAVMLYAHMHFVKKPVLLETYSVDKCLLIPNRSRSTTNASTAQSFSNNCSDTKNDAHFVARKQNSSIN